MDNVDRFNTGLKLLECLMTEGLTSENKTHFVDFFADVLKDDSWSNDHNFNYLLIAMVNFLEDNSVFIPLVSLYAKEVRARATRNAILALPIVKTFSFDPIFIIDNEVHEVLMEKDGGVIYKQYLPTNDSDSFKLPKIGTTMPLNVRGMTKDGKRFKALVEIDGIGKVKNILEEPTVEGELNEDCFDDLYNEIMPDVLKYND